ncbi:MAG: hypothetical protein GWP91_10650 [Rhodobacterales bacterium]|nr:hypothetical protein [Rhodobacterales bacterium]
MSSLPLNNQAKARYALAMLNGLVLLAVSGYYFSAIRPWTLPPDESDASVDARWVQVQAWAKVAEGGDGAAFDQMVALGHERWLDLDAAERPPVAPLLAALDDWTVAGTIGEVCDSRGVPKVIGFTLAVLASDQAAASAPKLLQLGQALRTRGSYVDLIVGLGVADSVRSWAVEHHQSLDESYERLRPRSEEVFFALARDAVCSQAQIDAMDSLEPPSPDTTWVAERPFGVDFFLSLEREQRWQKKYNTDRVHQAFPARADIHDLQRAHGQTPYEWPHSLLVRTNALFISHYILEDIQAYDAWMATP